MRLGWFIPFQRSLTDYDRVLPSVWIRCLQLIEPLQSLGVRSTINRPWAPMDVAIFLRVQGKWAQRALSFQRRRGVKTVFSVVVNYYEREGSLDTAGDPVSQRQVEECIAMTSMADEVITASRFLKERAGRHNANAHYLPDSVSRSHFRFTKESGEFDRKRLRLVWSGQGSKAGPIDMLNQAISELGLDLHLITNTRPRLQTPYRFVPWHYESFPREIVRADIGISPRTLDNSYDQGHSSFKIMVFLAQGLPVLASAQDSYLEVIRDGYNGFICHSPEEWRHRLETLVNNRRLLKEMSRNAITSAEPYLTESILPQYVQILRQMTGQQS